MLILLERQKLKGNFIIFRELLWSLSNVLTYRSSQTIFIETDSLRMEDLINLEKLELEDVLIALSTRCSQELMYTWISDILLSVNPNKLIKGLYGDQVIKDYRQNARWSPHVYAIANAAYQAILKSDRRSQSILISGESGAGKSESAKCIIEFLSTASHSHHRDERGSLDEKLRSSSPLLEAFGNAKTARNDNSSRFGKFIEIIFNTKGEIIGGKISTYLLEKSRVVKPNVS